MISKRLYNKIPKFVKNIALVYNIVEVFSKKEIKVHFKNGAIVIVDLLRKK